MTTIVLPRPIPTGHTRSTTPTLVLENINTPPTDYRSGRNLPIFPPIELPTEKPDSPPQSPPSKEREPEFCSLLYPPNQYKSRSLRGSKVYEIDATGVAAALDHIARQPLPDPSLVFPWFHGLHPCNHIQQAFFIARRRNLRKTPKCWRGVTIVKAGGDLSCSRLKGALAPEEFLVQDEEGTMFREIDPKEGFSVRNFQIQAAKSAMISDIIVYGERYEAEKLARDIAVAQEGWRDAHKDKGDDIPYYNTFICTSRFREFEEKHADIVATSSRGVLTGKVIDFFQQERIEMCTMTKASEIHHNVWLGPTPDHTIDPSLLPDDEEQFDILIECSDMGSLKPAILQAIAEDTSTSKQPIYLDFPSSGSIMPPTWSQTEADGILETCKWLYNVAHGIGPVSSEKDEDGDSQMAFEESPAPKPKEKKILIHCTDGYTESTLLGLSYYTYASGLPVPTAWLDLHMSKHRNFFAYPSDVALLASIAPRLLTESPVHVKKSLLEITELAKEEPEWIKNMDGSLPSRVLNYMYLGNLGHANNPDLLKQMGIGQILSVGETATWKSTQLDDFGKENVMTVQRVQDNGVDPLTDEFERCLEFIGMLRAICHDLKMSN
jgi:dual specificity MAP kinase phosphatase